MAFAWAELHPCPCSRNARKYEKRVSGTHKSTEKMCASDRLGLIPDSPLTSQKVGQAVI